MTKQHNIETLKSDHREKLAIYSKL